jgi:integrase
MTVRRKANGAWGDRVRFGQHRDMRIELPATLDKAQAEARMQRIRELAGRLHHVPDTEARIVLTEAQHLDLKAMVGVEQVVRELEAKYQPDAPPDRGMTFRELATQWNTGELHHKYPGNRRLKIKKSASQDTPKLEHLYKTIGDVPLRDFTEEHYYAALRSLPSKYSEGTIRHHAQLITKVLNLAAWPCKVIKVSPLPEGILPQPAHRRRPPLRPDEDARLLRCEAIDVLKRVLYGFLNRNGVRVGEALQYRWYMIDLDVEGIQVPAEITKTGAARAWKLDPDVAAVLRVMRGDEYDPQALVFPGLDEDHLADQFREELQQAGVTRHELFRRTATEDWVQVHSTRSTFVTVSLANGRSEAWVMARTGHQTSIVMRKHYLKMAEHFRDLELGSFLPMDELLGVAKRRPAQGAVRLAQGGVRQGVRQLEVQDVIKTEEIAMDTVGYQSGREGDRTPGKLLVRPEDGCSEEQSPAQNRQDSAESCTVVHAGAPGAPPEVRQPAALVDPVETALARAIEAATADREWPVVLELARQLEARRLARQAPEVTSLDAQRARRKGVAQ